MKNLETPILFPANYIDGPRGKLCVVQPSNAEIELSFSRAYYLFDMAIGEIRGLHAHRELKQVFSSLNGEIDVLLDDGLGTEHVYHLKAHNESLYVPPGYWRKIVSQTENSLLLVLASGDFDPNDYIWSYEEFVEWKTL